MATLSLLAITVMLQAGPAWADHQVVDRVSSGPLGGNTGQEADSFTISRDGSRSFVSTRERLVSEDTDDERDIYQRVAATTTLLSTGPAGGNGSFPAVFWGMSEDGSTVLFYTSERLTADDTDNRRDFYVRTGGTTALVSTGPAGGNGDFDVLDHTARMSADGSTVVFETREQLTADDTDALVDIYLRTGGQTTRIAGDGLFGLSRDGQRVFLRTNRHLTQDDTDGDFSDDAYMWEAGTTTILSVGPSGENPNQGVFFEHVDADGRHVVFTTFGRLVPEDTDDQADVYQRAGDAIERVGSGDALDVSADGSHVFFMTIDRLLSADTDSQSDIYVRAGGSTELVSAGPLAGDDEFQALGFQGSTPDGSHAFFHTAERLTPEDNDGATSLYRYSGGPAAQYVAPSANFPAWSDDGQRVFVVTHMPLVPSDTDTGCSDADIVGCEDVYEIRDGQATLLSTGPGDPNAGDSGVCRNVSSIRIVVDCRLAISADGSRVLFWHNAPLLAGDTDSSFDVWLASTGPVRSDYRNASHFCRAEREFLGEGAFRERYGTNGRGSNAFGKCVSSK
ncbi:MAG: TolB family protein [Solirubrobacterales bacterium]